MTDRTFVATVVRWTEQNITFDVMASRPLTRTEAALVIRVFRSSKEGRRLRRNRRYTLYSII